MAARQDLIDKYGLTKPDSWDNYVSYLKELAEKQGETGVTALNTNANREQLLTVYGQSKGVQGVTEGYDFEYYANNSDAQAYFENGTSGSFVWNSSVFTAGKNLEKAQAGTYSVYDVTPDVKRTRGSYSTDAIAITEKSEDPERAALVLDYMKGDVNLNRLLLGGIEGKHYSLDSDGNRTTLDGAEGYGWNNWAWAINRQDEPDEA